MNKQIPQRDHWMDGTDTVSQLEQNASQIIIGLPAYNEEVGIGSVVLDCRKYVDEVVVIDDGSTDRTVPVAEEAGATVIQHETNKGKGGAVKTFFEYVGDRELEAVVLMDADGQHNPADIPSVIEPVINGKADLVIGSRYLNSRDGEETPLYRRFGQRILDYLTLGSRSGQLTDTQSGFRALSPDAIDTVELTTDSIGTETEMTDCALRNDLTVEEVPVSVRYDGIDGQTYNPFKHGFIVVNFALGLVRDRHPLLFFGIPGLLLVFVGGLYGTQALLIYSTTGEFYPSKVLFSGFLTLFGTISLFTGLTLHTISYKIDQLEQSG